MIKDFQKYKERHLAFWALEDVKHPLIGFTIGAGPDAWSYWHYNKATQSLLNRGEISPDNINPNDFVEDQLCYLKLSKEIDDDVCRSAMPLASIPWMEAILGCPIVSTESSFRSETITDNEDPLELTPIETDNLWLKKYFEFISVYEQAFSDKYPVSQSVLRGPSDIACALIGAEKAAIFLLEDPERMHRILNYAAEQLTLFLQMQIKKLPQFQDGYVIGQYEIWTPEPPIRIQEDFSLLFSPDLYKEFLKSLDTSLATISNYTLIHLHSSSLHLIDQFLEISQLRSFQITKDSNVLTLNTMLPALNKIQEAGKPLILKGQFKKEDYDLILNQLSFRGLCIQPVVKNLSEANELLPLLKNYK
ncbi:MAG: uroporphyrinogen decarboxylase family protein [Ignavibacteriaceae bacterium]